jgi:hypothetical protein
MSQYGGVQPNTSLQLYPVQASNFRSGHVKLSLEFTHTSCRLCGYNLSVLFTPKYILLFRVSISAKAKTFVTKAACDRAGEIMCLSYTDQGVLKGCLDYRKGSVQLATPRRHSGLVNAWRAHEASLVIG